MKNLYKITSLLMSGALLLGVVSPVYAEEELKVMAEPIVAEEPVVSVEPEPIVAEEPVVSVEAEPIVAEDPVVSVEPEEPIVAEEAEELMEESHPLPEFTMNRLYTDGKGNFWTDEDYIITNRAETIEVNADLVEESVVFVEDEEPIVAEEPVVSVEPEEPVVSVEPEEPVVSVDPEQPEAEERSFTINIDYNFIEKTTTDSDFSNIYDDLMAEIDEYIYNHILNVKSYKVVDESYNTLTPETTIQNLTVIIEKDNSTLEPKPDPDPEPDPENPSIGIPVDPQPEEKLNSITFSKVILNSDGEKATDEDFKEMWLDSDWSYNFKITLTNIETNEYYNIILNSDEPKTISGLKAGTYKIEEADDNYFDFSSFELDTNGLHDSSLTKKDDGYYITICDCDEIEHSENIIVNNELEEHRGYEDKDEENNGFWIPKQQIANIPILPNQNEVYDTWISKEDIDNIPDLG